MRRRVPSDSGRPGRPGRAPGGPGGLDSMGSGTYIDTMSEREVALERQDSTVARAATVAVLIAALIALLFVL